MKESRREEREKGNLKKVFKNEIGITLIALIVTVIIMLILAGVAISVLTSGEGLFEKTQLAVDTYNQAVQDESDKITSLLNEIDAYMNGIPKQTQNEYSGGVWTGIVNSPKMTLDGMIAVKYNTTTGKWVKADESNQNNDWYNYSETASGNAVAKQWANMVTVKENGINSRADYVNAGVGTAIEMDDILTMFVWIPRYAYSIADGYKEVMDGTTPETTAKVDIEFLEGTTNKGVSNIEYSRNYNAGDLNAGDETPMIVHPAFTWADINGTPVELEGIWVAKFEASGVNDLANTDVSTASNIEDNWTNYVGNRSEDSDTAVAVTANTVLTVKPSVPSWREITTGNAQMQSMKLTNSTVYGWAINTVDSHLMKNTEWGAVAYLCYSEYGNIPMINCVGSEHINGSGVIDRRYDMVTGGGPKTLSDETQYAYDRATFITEHSYSTENGKLASTTGNVYGVYDMNGGAWERVAGYLNNGNYNLKKYAGEGGNVDYFDGTGGTTSDSILKSKYEKYWDRYEVGEQEKINAIVVENDNLTQAQLWNSSKYQLKYENARKRITKETVNNMIANKGDAMYEIIKNGEFSFYSPYNSGSAVSPTYTWDWFKENLSEPDGSSLRARGRSWNGDYVLIGHSAATFIARGGTLDDSSSAGVCSLFFTSGNVSYHNGFRPVLAF